MGHKNEEMLLNALTNKDFKTDISDKKFRKFSSRKIEADFFSNITKISEYMQEVDRINSTEEKKTVAKSVRFSGYEMILVSGFLKKNGITIGNLVKFFFYQAGAFDDFAVYVMEKKGMNIDFARYNPKEWNLDSHKQISIILGNEEKSVHSDLLSQEDINSLYTMHKKESETPSMNFHKFQVNLMEKFLIEHKEEYKHFNRFVKMMMLDFKIFPPQLSSKLEGNMKAKSTKSTKNKKNKDSEKNSENTTAAAAHPLTLTTHPFERLYVDNFAEFAKTIDPQLSLAKIIKYKLYDLGYIGDMKRYPIEHARKNLSRLKDEFDPSFDYREQKKFEKKDHDEYKKQYQELKVGAGNLAISFHDEDAEKLIKSLHEELDPATGATYGTITKFVREKVLKDYNIYPFPELLEIIENPPHKKRGKKKA